MACLSKKLNRLLVAFRNHLDLDEQRRAGYVFCKGGPHSGRSPGGVQGNTSAGVRGRRLPENFQLFGVSGHILSITKIYTISILELDEYNESVLNCMLSANK